MGITLPRAELLDLVQGLTELPARWEGEAEQQWGIWETQPSAYCELSISAYKTAGCDEYRQTFDTFSQQLSSSISGIREFTLTMKAKSYELGTLPADVLERFRLRIQSASGRFVLTNAGVALIRCFPVVVLPRMTEEDNRGVFVAVMDTRLAFAVDETADDDGGTIIVTVNSGQPPIANVS